MRKGPWKWVMPEIGIRIWLDDVRPMPLFEYDINCKTATEAIELLKTGRVGKISLDHDLGDGNGTGYDVAKYIEEAAYFKQINRLRVLIHSDNCVGVRNMRQAIDNANKFWNAASSATERQTQHSEVAPYHRGQP